MGVCHARHTHHKGGSVHSAPPGQPFISRPLAPGLLPPFAPPSEPSSRPSPSSTALCSTSDCTAPQLPHYGRSAMPMPSGASWYLASLGGRRAGNLWGVVTGPSQQSMGGPSRSLTPPSREFGSVSLLPLHKLWGVPIRPQQQQTWGVGWGSFFAPRPLRRRQPVASSHAAFFRSQQQL